MFLFENFALRQWKQCVKFWDISLSQYWEKWRSSLISMGLEANSLFNYSKTEQWTFSNFTKLFLSSLSTICTIVYFIQSCVYSNLKSPQSVTGIAMLQKQLKINCQWHSKATWPSSYFEMKNNLQKVTVQWKYIVKDIVFL